MILMAVNLVAVKWFGELESFSQSSRSWGFSFLSYWV